MFRTEHFSECARLLVFVVHSSLCRYSAAPFFSTSRNKTDIEKVFFALNSTQSKTADDGLTCGTVAWIGLANATAIEHANTRQVTQRDHVPLHYSPSLSTVNATVYKNDVESFQFPSRRPMWKYQKGSIL